MMSVRFNHVAISNIHGADYCCIISGTSKIGAINLMQNVYLGEKSGTSKNIKIYYHIKKSVKKL